jgi:uncharacterized protein YaaW (UPF0174 family)
MSDYNVPRYRVRPTKIRAANTNDLKRQLREKMMETTIKREMRDVILRNPLRAYLSEEARAPLDKLARELGTYDFMEALVKDVYWHFMGANSALNDSHAAYLARTYHSQVRNDLAGWRQRVEAKAKKKEDGLKPDRDF